MVARFIALCWQQSFSPQDVCFRLRCAASGALGLILVSGLGSQGGAIDHWDKSISGPLFKLRVHWLVEAAIVVPGSMFGAPLKSVFMLPSWIPLILDRSDLLYLFAVTVPINLWGANRIQRWLRDPFQGELVLCSKTMPLAGFIHLALASRLCRHDAASSAISFYLCSWIFSQTLNQIIKNVFWRRRPTACMNETDGVLAPRHYPQFKIWLMQRPQSLESFPSGDAAGAASFGYAAYLFTGIQRSVSVSFSVFVPIILSVPL